MVPKTPYKARATLTSKGQITVPAQHRKAWGLKPGDQVRFVPERINGQFTITKIEKAK